MQCCVPQSVLNTQLVRICLLVRMCVCACCCLCFSELHSTRGNGTQTKDLKSAPQKA